jgi:hypothetical protein
MMQQSALLFHYAPANMCEERSGTCPVTFHKSDLRIAAHARIKEHVMTTACFEV